MLETCRVRVQPSWLPSACGGRCSIFLVKSAPRRTQALARRGLTPNDSRALFSLDAGQGRSMRSLADEWECDPSNTTWIVDRLEKLGLAERRAVPADRRVKLVALTPKGSRTRALLMQDFYHAPPEFAALDVDDLKVLERILSKLAPTERHQSTGLPKPTALQRRQNHSARSRRRNR